jgi:hypothetical protein
MVALSPLLSMRPSRGQLRVARLRERAAIKGLSVQLRDPPITLRQRDASMAFYQLRRDRGQRETGERVVCLCREGHWVADQGKPGEIRLGLLQELPAGLLALVADPDTVGVYWEETGEVEDVDRIAELLMQWCEAARN